MESTHVARLAEICASRVDPASPSFDENFPLFKNEMNQLLDALKAMDPRFLFDRFPRYEGRYPALSGSSSMP